MSGQFSCIKGDSKNLSYLLLLHKVSVKNGIKENTLVVTVKSHTHNVPTLLIEHVK